MTARRRGTWLLGVVALAAGISMMVAAYGVAATRSHAAPQHAQKVGTLRAVLDTIDFLDPQQAYTGQSWWAMWNVYETLLTYNCAHSYATAVGLLADRLDGRLESWPAARKTAKPARRATSGSNRRRSR